MRITLEIDDAPDFVRQVEQVANGVIRLHAPDGNFTDVTDKAVVTNERWGFGVVVGDYDNDGWPVIYHNNHDGTFTGVCLDGRRPPARDVFSGGSYASSSDQRLHFGLGTATKVDKVEISWPDGVKEEIKIPAIDRVVTVVKGKGTVEP